jgi:hypothetical protein
MTSRERLLAAYRGEEVDRLPYWPKVLGGNWRSGQQAAVARLDDLQLLDAIGADGLFGGGQSVLEGAIHHITNQVHEDGGRRQISWSTPDGPMVERSQFDAVTKSWHPIEYPVKTLDDLRRARWLFDRIELRANPKAIGLSKARLERIGQRGIMKTAWGASPWMTMVERLAGPVQAHLLLSDHAVQMVELLDLMHRANLKRLEMFAQHTPAEVICSIENTSTTLISPAQFDRFCLPHLTDYGRVIEQSGRWHELHMCGQIGQLLKRIETIPAVSIEAFSSAPIGDARLVDGRTRVPSKTLLGGTCANIWLEPPERIEAFLQEELDACGDHRRIIVTTGGEAPQGCSIDTFQRIGRWLAEVPVRTRPAATVPPPHLFSQPATGAAPVAPLATEESLPAVFT